MAWKPFTKDDDLSSLEMQWLSYEGSLTAKLRQLSPDLTLEVVNEGEGPLLDFEAKLMGREPSAPLWTREITMTAGKDAGGGVWLFARTVVSPELMQSHGDLFRGLGTKPLGALLSDDPSFRRVTSNYAHLDQEQVNSFTSLKPHLSSPTASVWARSSLWTCEDKPLVLTEAFLDGLWRHIRASER